MNKSQNEALALLFCFRSERFITATDLKLEQASAEDGVIPEGQNVPKANHEAH